MATTFVYPTAQELREIAQDKMPVFERQDPIFRHFGIVDEEADNIAWEQRDNYYGLQQLRGLGGQPNRVIPVGGKHYVEIPGVYGEHMPIQESELTKRRQWGQWTEYYDISKLVMQKQDFLLQRRWDRIRQILWALVVNGTFSVSLPNGGVGHSATYTFQTYTGSHIATLGSATPLIDIRGVQLLARGHSVSFGRDAELFINQTTANNILENTNANDLGGKRLASGASIFTLGQVNTIFLDNNLPQLVVWDDTYFATAGAAPTTFIPDNMGVLIGNRPQGQMLGEYMMTRNINNDNMAPGAYQKVIDHDEEVPRSLSVHDGHNGGPAMFFPAAVVVITWT